MNIQTNHRTLTATVEPDLLYGGGASKPIVYLLDALGQKTGICYYASDIAGLRGGMMLDCGTGEQVVGEEAQKLAAFAREALAKATR